MILYFLSRVTEMDMMFLYMIVEMAWVVCTGWQKWHEVFVQRSRNGKGCFEQRGKIGMGVTNIMKFSSQGINRI